MGRSRLIRQVLLSDSKCIHDLISHGLNNSIVHIVGVLQLILNFFHSIHANIGRLPGQCRRFAARRQNVLLLRIQQLNQEKSALLPCLGYFFC